MERLLVELPKYPSWVKQGRLELGKWLICLEATMMRAALAVKMSL
jgi:hypothetical protein